MKRYKIILMNIMSFVTEVLKDINTYYCTNGYLQCYNIVLIKDRIYKQICEWFYLSKKCLYNYYNVGY